MSDKIHVYDNFPILLQILKSLTKLNMLFVIKETMPNSKIIFKKILHTICRIDIINYKHANVKK